MKKQNNIMICLTIAFTFLIVSISWAGLSVSPSIYEKHVKPGVELKATYTVKNIGSKKQRITIEADDWTVKTLDGKPSAHFEHTVALTDKGQEILTWRKMHP